MRRISECSNVTCPVNVLRVCSYISRILPQSGSWTCRPEAVGNSFASFPKLLNSFSLLEKLVIWVAKQPFEERGGKVF